MWACRSRLLLLLLSLYAGGSDALKLPSLTALRGRLTGGLERQAPAVAAFEGGAQQPEVLDQAEEPNAPAMTSAQQLALEKRAIAEATKRAAEAALLEAETLSRQIANKREADAAAEAGAVDGSSVQGDLGDPAVASPPASMERASVDPQMPTTADAAVDEEDALFLAETQPLPNDLAEELAAQM